MYLTKREQVLVSMLRIRPRTGAELADILAISRRTVVREVASVNAKLEAERAGHIESGQRYRLEVGSEDCLRALLSDELSDEQAILLHVLTAPDQSFTSLSQATYPSRLDRCVCRRSPPWRRHPLASGRPTTGRCRACGRPKTPIIASTCRSLTSSRIASRLSTRLPTCCALYVLASMECPERRPVSVLVLSNRRSMSTINQRLIEQNVDKVDVQVACDDVSARTALGEREWDLAVRDEDYPTAIEGVSWDMAFRGVLDASELKLIRTMALDILYRKNVARMLDEDGYFHLHNKPGQVYLTVLEDVLGRLVDAHHITSAEADLIRERERAGKRLNVKGIAFPHAITPVESDGFRLFVACLDEPVTDMDATIGLIIVVLASQSQADKSSIFTYLLSVIEDATARSESLPRTYEETLRYLGSV